MRLYLAVAMLMLAFVAYTEAQDATVEDKFTQLGQDMSNMGQTVLDKVKTTFDEIQNSEFAANTRRWFEETAEKLKNKFQQ